MRDFVYLVGYTALMNVVAVWLCLLLVGIIEMCLNTFLVLLSLGLGARVLSWAWYYPQKVVPSPCSLRGDGSEI